MDFYWGTILLIQGGTCATMMEMYATIQNDAGIHCRPSAEIYKFTEHYSGRILICANGEKVKLSSIMDIIALGLHKGDRIMIQVYGENEAVIIKKLVDLFETHFDFPQIREKR
jgi:phosphocarrier protein HPr